MDVKSTIAAQNYAAIRPATAPSVSPGGTEALRGLGTEFATFLQNGEETVKAGMTGQADAQALVQALAQTELAVETAVTIRNKVVEAYQEILRMPV